MRTTLRLVNAGVLVALGLTAANAAPLSAPLAARDATSTGTELVHCIPGVMHPHRWGWSTGCFRPRVYYGQRFYAPRFYGAGPRFYGGGPRFYRGEPRFYGGGFGRHW